MRRLSAAILVLCLGFGGAGCVGCPTALLEGILVADGTGELAVLMADGTIEPVHWAGDVHVRQDGDHQVLVNQLGFVVAREGEYVRAGGGEDPEGPGFKACGSISVAPSGPATQ